MTFDVEPSTPVRNAMLNTEQRITSIVTTEIRTPAQSLDYFMRLGAWCAQNVAHLESTATIGSAHA